MNKNFRSNEFWKRTNEERIKIKKKGEWSVRPRIGSIAYYPCDIQLARKKRGHTQPSLAEASSLGVRSIKSVDRTSDTLDLMTPKIASAIATALRFPKSVIFVGEVVDVIKGIPVVARFEESLLPEGAIPGLGGKGTVSNSIATLLGATTRTMTDFFSTTENKTYPQYFKLSHIREFWNIMDREMSSGDSASISGTLSCLSPVIIGDPYGKCDLHRAYRRQSVLDEESQPRDVIDSCMAFTAGQLVWNLPEMWGWKCYGLYQSIVRNSIPVFINESYLRKQLIPQMQNQPNQLTCSVEIRGKVGRVRGFASLVEQRGFIQPVALGPQKPLGLFIDGDDGTFVRVIGESSYLDGDIFFVVTHEGHEFVVSRFLDLSSDKQIHTQTEELVKDCEEKYPDGKVVMRYDNITGNGNETDIDDVLRLVTFLSDQKK